MNSYKVELVQSDRFVVDVQAKDEQEAADKAGVEWNKIAEAGIYHYHQVGDTEVEIGTIYDVSGTDDDPFIK